MNQTKIKRHINRLSKGYRIWAVPLLMLMWDVAFKTGGGKTAENVIKELLSTPWFLMISAWIIIFGLAMDHRGKLLAAALQDTDNLTAISYTMLEHNRFADFLMISPVIYYICKAVVLMITGISPGWNMFMDIHGVMTLIATWDTYQSVMGNILIRKELEY